MPRWTRRLSHPGILSLVVVLAVFGRTLGNGFVFDDHPLVERNPVVRTLDPLSHLGASFWSRWETGSDYYRPLVTWSLALDRAVYGEAPWGYHLTNLLVHAGNVLLVFLLLRDLGLPFAGGAGAVLFAVHPVQVEPVAFVLGRTDLLAVLFLLLTLRLYLRPRLGLSLLTLGMALLSKESAATFPVLALAADLLRRGRAGPGLRAEALRFARRLAPYLALIAVCAAVRAGVVGQLLGGSGPPEDAWRNPLTSAPLLARWLTAVVVASRYVALLLFPGRLSVDYGFDVVPLVHSPASPSFLVSAAGLVALAGAIGLIGRGSPVARFGAVVATGTYLPMSHLLFPAPLVMAERFLYLPMLGACAIAAGALLHLTRPMDPLAKRGWLTPVLTLALATPLAARSFVRCGDWRDDLTLFRAATASAPRSAMAWNNVGLEWLRRGDGPAGERCFERAVEIHPGYVGAHVNRAVALRERGDLAGAERSLRDTADRFPGDDDVQVALVSVLALRAEGLARQGRALEARAVHEEIARTGRGLADRKAAEGRPGVQANLLLTVAQSLALVGRTAEAEQALETARIAAEREIGERGSIPEVDFVIKAGVLGGAGWLLARTGRPLEAAARFEEARLAAEAAGDASLAARMELDAGRALLAAGRIDAAVQALRRASLRAPGDPVLGQQLLDATIAFAEGALAAGRVDEALELYEQLLAASPGNVRALHGRGRARLAIGDLTGAEEDLQVLAAQTQPPRLAAALWADLALVASGRNDSDEAMRRLDRAVALDPGYGEARLRRGLLYRGVGQPREAEQDVVAALAAGLPQALTAEAWLSAAELARYRGDLAAARQRLRRCLDVEPGHPRAAELLRRLGG
jgi:tetratricopeptide (TPR) repeat protein